MQINFNDKKILALSETQKKVIKNDIPEEVFEADMRRRLHYIIENPCEKWMNHTRKDNLELLKSKGATSIPSDRTAFVSELGKHDPKLCLDPLDDQELCLKVDGVEHCTFKEDQKRIWKKMHGFDYQLKMEAQLQWILLHKVERCMARLRLEWEPKIKERYPSYPIADEAFAELVFSQPDYKNRSEKEANKLRV